MANYAAEGDGWDGPGRGTARLTYYLSRPSVDLDVERQLREVSSREGTRCTHDQDVEPVWRKLSRRGDPLLASRSTDGQRSVFVGSEKVPMGGLVFVGVAASSHTRHALREAVFDHGSVTGSGVQDP